MDPRLEDRIRQRAFELSEEPERSEATPVDNWLEAERQISDGLAEDAPDFLGEEAAPTATERAGAERSVS